MRIRDILFSVMRRSMEQEYLDIELSNGLLEISISQSILPIIYHGLKRMTVPAQLLGQFDRAWIRNVFWHSQR